RCALDRPKRFVERRTQEVSQRRIHTIHLIVIQEKVIRTVKVPSLSDTTRAVQPRLRLDAEQLSRTRRARSRTAITREAASPKFKRRLALRLSQSATDTTWEAKSQVLPTHLDVLYSKALIILDF